MAFTGFEWTQAGRVPEEHWGHRCVVFPGTADDELPARPIAARNTSEGSAGLAGLARRTRWAGLLDWPVHERFALHMERLAARTECRNDVASPEIDDDACANDCTSNACTDSCTDACVAVAVFVAVSVAISVAISVAVDVAVFVAISVAVSVAISVAISVAVSFIRVH